MRVTLGALTTHTFAHMCALHSHMYVCTHMHLGCMLGSLKLGRLSLEDKMSPLKSHTWLSKTPRKEEMRLFQLFLHAKAPMGSLLKSEEASPCTHSNLSKTWLTHQHKQLPPPSSSGLQALGLDHPGPLTGYQQEESQALAIL